MKGSFPLKAATFKLPSIPQLGFRKSSRLSRLGVLIGGSLLVSVSLMTLTGCDQATTDPMQQTIPTESETWQEELGDTFDKLPETDRELLGRYMLRMKLGEAYETGAMPSTTIADALEQQREYEQLHPNNPTGEDSPVTETPVANINSQLYPITLLPTKTSDDDSLNNIKLKFLLSNQGEVAIKSFKGSLLVQADAFEKGKPIVIPLTAFDPPIEPQASGELVVESSIADVNVIQAIKDPQAVTVVITEGSFTMENGEQVNIEESAP